MPASSLGLDERLQVAQPLGLDLWKHGLQDVALKHDPDGAEGSSTAEQLEQFVGDPFARERHQVVGPLGAGCERRRIRLARPEARVETEEAQDPKMVLGNALQRVADEPDVPVLADRRGRRNSRRSRRSADRRTGH